MDKEICCYMMVDTTDCPVRKSYRGYTVNLPRRLRQHRGEIKGGARATRRFADCQIAAYTTGFTTKREALSYEWHTKRARKQDPRPPYMNAKLRRFAAPWRLTKFKAVHPKARLYVNQRVWPYDAELEAELSAFTNGVAVLWF